MQSARGRSIARRSAARGARGSQSSSTLGRSHMTAMPIRSTRIALNPLVYALAAALALPAVHALAQSTDAPASPDQGPKTLDVITVTAEKREEDIQKVPVSISAISGENLDVIKSGSDDIQFLSARVPSLLVESSFGRTF